VKLKSFELSKLKVKSSLSYVNHGIGVSIKFSKLRS
jgi:hypothetical protein